MQSEQALRELVSPASAQRGDDYFAKGRVRSLELIDDDLISAIVVGTRRYEVQLRYMGDEIIVSCECPWFEQEWDACKHVWAAIREASSRSLLPRGLVMMDFASLDSDELPAAPFPMGRSAEGGPGRRQTAPWERFLLSLGAPVAPAAPPTRALPEEIAYVLGPAYYGTSLSIRLHGRSHKKNGDWAKWKALSLRSEDLRSLPPFDRESISLLHNSRYDHRVDQVLELDAAMVAWWAERLARAGRLFIRDADDNLHQVTWDDGPEWTFRVTIGNDAAAALYRIEGTIERALGTGDTPTIEVLPLREVALAGAGILVARDRASRFDDGGRSSWLHSLHMQNAIEVPHADGERFRQALLRSPIAGVELPPELGWELVDATPRPLLSLQDDTWSAEMKGDLFFVYDEWRVPFRATEIQKTIGRKLIRRNRRAEAGYRDRLATLSLITSWGEIRIRPSQLEQVTRQLIEEGWSIEVNASPLRFTDDIDLEISSGIDWFDLNVSASFGDLRVQLPELLDAAAAKTSVLRLSDGSFGVIPASWSEALAPVLDLGKRQGDSVRFRPAQALLVDALLQKKTQKSEEAFAGLRQRLTGTAPAPRQEPASLLTTLRPYQREGLGWLHFLREAGLGGCLADDMGLGKTVQTLALLESVRAGGGDRPSLVVAPRSLLFNWAAEAARFAPQLRIREHHGADRLKSGDLFAGCDLVLTTYATMRLDIAHLSEVEFEYVILDEAQAIKNAGSLVAKASRLLRGRHRLALSGTPIENHLGELWSLFEFLDPGLLGSLRAFNRTFASKSAPPERRNALARALRPLILRRTKEQVAPELPERVEQTRYCELEGKQKRQYEELRLHYRNVLLGNVRKAGIEKSRMQILEALLRLRQAACHPGLIDGVVDTPSAKTELLLVELRDVVASGHRALVFSQFTSFLAIVRTALEKEGLSYCYLDGKTRDRQALVEQFQDGGGPPIFLISLKAGGLGLNLTNADYIFLLDPWWNPAVEAQAIDRAHRIGRLRPVVAYRLIARDTVEEKILELQTKKRDLADSILSEDNSVLRRLEVEDLELLLS